MLRHKRNGGKWFRYAHLAASAASDAMALSKRSDRSMMQSNLARREDCLAPRRCKSSSTTPAVTKSALATRCCPTNVCESNNLNFRSWG